MAPKILVVDNNKAFAIMLKEMLESEGGYEVEAVHTGGDALARMHDTAFDLTIVDMGLDPQEMGYRQLVANVRRSQPVMRVMLIPFMSQNLPPEAHQLDIQGALAKPFFADDLLPSIREALAKEVRPSAPPAAAPPEPTPPAPVPQVPVEQAVDLEGVLSELARETNASAVLLMSATARSQNVIAQISTLNDRGLDAFTYLTLATIQAAQAMGRFLGQPDEPFEHNMFESSSLRLYIMALPQKLLLVMVTPVSTPLGTIRHNLRRAGRLLAKMALT